MPPLVHLIDAASPADSLDQLACLRRAAQPVFSIGPAGRGAPAPGGASAEDTPAGPVAPADVFCLRRPFGLAGLVRGALRRRLPAGAILQVWSLDLLPLAAAVADDIGGRTILSLPALPRGRPARLLPWTIGRYRCLLTVPTARARRALLAAGADPARVAVLPPAGCPGEPLPDRAAVRRELGLAADDLALVVPSPMLRHAGHKWASWAHAIVRHVRDDVRLVFAETGPFSRSVKFFASTTGFGGEVRTTAGRIPLHDALAACDLAAFLHETDLGLNRLVAACRAGLPVLASRTLDFDDFLTHEHNALLVPPAHPRETSAALLRLADDPDLRSRLAAAGRDLADRWTPANARRAMDELLAIGPL